MNTKLCTSCKQYLPIDNFSLKNGKIYSHCRECKRARNRAWWGRNLDTLHKKQHEAYIRDKEKIVERNEKYRKSHLHQYRKYGKASKIKLKFEVFSHYCNGAPKCNGCGLDELNLLTIDHVNGGGNKHRKEIGVSTSYPFYLWLKENNYPDGFQILCWNCQFKKRKKEMASLNSTAKKLRRAKFVAMVKLEVLSHYGKICTCGCEDIDALTLDHVNDDGAEHRKTTNTRGYSFYLMLRKNDFPNDPPLQVKCLNCQYRKRIENEKRKCNQDFSC